MWADFVGQGGQGWVRRVICNVVFLDVFPHVHHIIFDATIENMIRALRVAVERLVKYTA